MEIEEPKPQSKGAALHYKMGMLLGEFYEDRPHEIPQQPHSRVRLYERDYAVPHKVVISGYYRGDQALFLVLAYRKPEGSTKWRPFAGYARERPFTEVEEEARGRLEVAAKRASGQVEEVQHELSS